MSPRSLLALALLAPAAIARPPVPAPRGYDLRGPALEKGLKLTVKQVSSLKDGEMEMDPGTGQQKFKVTTSETHEEEVELLAAEGRQPTRMRTKIVKGETKATYDGPEVAGGQANPLVGQTVTSTLEKDGKGKRAWKHELDKGEPTDEQKPHLQRVGAWSGLDGMFPARKVRVGESWEVNTKDLLTFPGSGAPVQDFSAKGRGKLRAVEKFQGEQCAVVEVTLTFKGKQKTDPLTLEAESSLKMTFYRSLRRGLTLKMTADGALKVTTDSPKMTLSGKQRIVTTVAVKGG